ncbi:MAG: hypothetical protein KY475_17385 [Planctomycetes bacterium]|nr:hypothetical protein [Planctomycetota bacterium]
MSAATPPGVDLRQLVAIVKARWRWCAATTAVAAIAAIVYAVAKPDVWQARQALVVRDEAVGDLNRQGRFDSSDAMKSAQELVLEVARNRSVVEAALRSAGPPADAAALWPDADAITRTQDALAVTAPKGAEFGQTEIIYLTIKAKSRERAVSLVAAVCDQLEHRLQGLRGRKAESVIEELTRTLSLAQADLDEATARLQAIEAEVGSDLGELRILNEAAAGDSNLRASLNQIKTDLRQARAGYTAAREQLQLLLAARTDEKQLFASSSRLLDSQPALRRLKEGLVDAQLRTAALRGRMSADHPNVREAVAAEEEVRRHLQHELDAAIAGLRADLQVTGAQIAAYEEQLAEVTDRLDRLASLRARYANLQSEVRQRAEAVQRVQQDLATARASQAAAASASLLTRMDAPLADDRPLGPRRAMIVLAGLFGGLATGVGLALLTAPATRGWGRRWSDYLRHGRRADDRPPSPEGQTSPRARRAEDRTPGRRASDARRDRRGSDKVGADNLTDELTRLVAEAQQDA